jgi:hypothetical protein
VLPLDGIPLDWLASSRRWLLVRSVGGGERLASPWGRLLPWGDDGDARALDDSDLCLCRRCSACPQGKDESHQNDQPLDHENPPFYGLILARAGGSVSDFLPTPGSQEAG